MDCLTCQGACCEAVSLSLSEYRPAGVDRRTWAKVHGEPTGLGLNPMPQRCPALTGAGRCGIYEERPEPCRAYEPGCDACLATVRERRTRAQYARIRNEQDPTVSVLYD